MTTADPLEHMRQLHARHLTNETRVRAFEMENHKIRQELLDFMVAEGSTRIEGVCDLDQETDYDQAAFDPLKEIFNAAELKDCFIEGHWEYPEKKWVKEKWKTGKVKKWAKKWGRSAMVYMDQAAFKQPAKVKMIQPETKKETSASDDS